MEYVLFSYLDEVKFRVTQMAKFKCLILRCPQ